MEVSIEQELKNLVDYAQLAKEQYKATPTMALDWLDAIRRTSLKIKKRIDKA